MTSNEIPEHLNTPEFLEAWADWKEHRIEIKKPLTQVAIKRGLKKLSRYTAKQAIHMIDCSIESGWQGLFESCLDSMCEVNPFREMRVVRVWDDVRQKYIHTSDPMWIKFYDENGSGGPGGSVNSEEAKNTQ